MPEVIALSDAIPANIQHPLDTEAATASGLKALFSKPIADWVNFWDRRLKGLGATDTRTASSDSETYSDFVIPAESLVGADNAFKRIAQAAGNRFKYLRERIPGLAVNYPIFTPLVAAYNENSRFTFQATGNVWRQTDVTDAGRLIFPVQLPKSGTVTGVSCYVKNTTGRAGLPATLPLMNLKQTSLGTGVESNASGGIVDPSASLAAYEQAHFWSSGVLSHVIDGSATYWFEFTGEAGANASANKLEIIALTVNVSP